MIYDERTLFDILSRMLELEKIETKTIVNYQDEGVEFNVTIYKDKNGILYYQDKFGFHTETQYKNKTFGELEMIATRLNKKKKEIQIKRKDSIKLPSIKVIKFILGSKMQTAEERIDSLQSYLNEHGK
jgi:hypothetical protein